MTIKQIDLEWEWILLNFTLLDRHELWKHFSTPLFASLIPVPRSKIGNAARSSVERLHELVPKYPVGEIVLSQRGGVGPWLQPVLLSNGLCEALAPSHSRILLHDMLDGVLVHQLAVAADVI